MKKFPTFIFAALLAAGVFGATETVDGVTYTYSISNGKATIGNGSSAAIPQSTSGALIIPSTLGGCPVTSIGSGAFYNCSSLTSVTIPSSVTNISYDAFAYCTDLREVILHEGLEVIRSGAFMNCSKLATINIPSTVQQIGGRTNSATFEDCPLLGDEGVVIIDNCVIKVNGDCPDTVVLPKGTRVIADNAFNGKAGLKEIVIPDGVICIGERAFSSTGLTAVYLPDSVKYVGAKAFSNCKTLKSVRLPKELTAIAEDLFAYCNMLQEVTIPEHIKSVGDRAFSNCEGLKNVAIPDSVTSIGNYAFYNCTKLTSIVIGKKVESIGSEAFENCTSLVALDIPNSVTALGYKVGFHCSNLKKLKIGSGVTTIPTHAFDECYYLQEIILGRNVAYVDQYAFYNRGCYQTFICRGTNVYWTSYATWGSRTIKTEIQEPSVTKGAAEITAKEDGGYSVVTSDLTAKISIPDDVDDDQVSFVIYRNSYDIAPYLSFHRDGYGIFDLSAAVVKPEIVKEAMDPEKGAVIELSSENPTLTTAETKPGLTYTLVEGTTLESMANGDSTVGDGQPWSPNITIKGGNSGFYTIKVSK